VIDFSQRLSELEVRVQDRPGGRLLRRSQYEFEYARDATAPISLILPLADGAFRDNELFAVMDMNLPEGFLLAQIRELAPKTPPTKMHLLALMGTNGIGRLAYSTDDTPPSPGKSVSRARLLREGSGRGARTFRDLVHAYLSTGSGLSGVQPKILVPDRSTIPVPNLLVKASSPEYPGLAANEFLCLEVARRAGLDVPRHELSDDGTLLVIDRFDLRGKTRLGFEDLAALFDLRVGGALSDRKYRGSYESLTRLLPQFCSEPAAAQSALFDQLCLSVLVRNGDAHLKNFGVLYDDERCWLAPVFDVVTTTIYSYERAGRLITDRTMALRLEPGGDRGYPLPDVLLAFGRTRCGLADPEQRVERLGDAMRDTLRDARKDSRVPRKTLTAMAAEWEDSLRRW
jgi:serine/threonine-protein kinase HipA